jgi:hypothetical protein
MDSKQFLFMQALFKQVLLNKHYLERLRFVFIPVFTAFLTVCPAQAYVPRPLYEAPEALAMGNAVTGFIEDHNAIWYNPAGAAAFDSFEWRLLNFDLRASKDIYDSYSTISKLKNPGVGDVNDFMGKNLFAQTTVGTSLMLPQFGIAALYDKRESLLRIRRSRKSSTAISVRGACRWRLDGHRRTVFDDGGAETKGRRTNGVLDSAGSISCDGGAFSSSLPPNFSTSIKTTPLRG